MEGILNDSPWSGTQVMRLIYNDEKFEVRVRGAPDGRWTVMPDFLPSLWGTAVRSLNVAKSPRRWAVPARARRTRRKSASEVPFVCAGPCAADMLNHTKKAYIATQAAFASDVGRKSAVSV